MTRTHTAALVLFVGAGTLLLHAPRICSASSGPAEKLILGFEQAELSRGAEISRQEKSGRDSWFYLLERPEGFDFAARFEWPGASNRAWTWRCRPGERTEGEMALVATVAPVDSNEQAATYRRTEYLSYFYRRLRSGRWAPPVDLTGEFAMDEYRSLAGFSVPPYAPENFVPLVWSDHDTGAVKLLSIPVSPDR